jgi:hypothetical protein
MESAERERQTRRTQPDVSSEAEVEHRKRSLLLSRTRVLHDLENATHERHRGMLREALAHLDKEIAKLG